MGVEGIALRILNLGVKRRCTWRK